MARLQFPAGYLVLLLLAATTSVRGQEQAARPTDLVNTLRGSDSTSRYSRGNTFPALAVPFGFNLWTPVTQPNSTGWLYEYADSKIHGFAVSHEPSPWLGDYATFQIMPSVGTLAFRDEERGQAFSHARELARAHYYRVDLDSGIRVELTPTSHAAALRFTFPARGPCNLVFDAPDKATGAMQADAAHSTVSGSVSFRGPTLYFFAQLDAPVQSAASPQGSGPGVALSFSFSNKAPRAVTLRIATSYISVEQARAHLQAELGEQSFDALQAQAQTLWDSYLGRIRIEGASDSQMVTFYSNLYRALLYPNSMTELVDQVPKHFSPYSNDVRSGVMYVNNGFWDTYRAAWPLYTLLLPQQAGTMLEGFVNAYREGGWVPRWSAPGYRDVMVGTHSDAVFADAYLKGVRNFDVQAAYASMLKNALVVSNREARGRSGMGRGMFRSYIPHEDTVEAAAWHLENNVNDFSISRLAHALGDTTHAEYLRLRSLNYAALFSPSLGFFRGRLANGEFRTSDRDFRAEEWGHEFTEGCAWHYVAAANHDPGGMIALYGGAKAFTDKLDALLSASPSFLVGSYKQEIHEMLEARDGGMGQYAHPNEPTHHILYMYDYAGQPWQTQKHVRKVLSESSPFYNDGAKGGGYLGDEDNGQMSAWYVFSALGFYPASPGHASYAIGSPLFKRATLQLEDGKAFEVVAHDNSERNVYIQRATLNGAAHDLPYLTHAQIVSGGVLELFMGESPSTWGSAGLARPEHADTRALAAGGVLTDCAQGGAASASSENAENDESARAAFDDDSRTKWLATAPSASLRYLGPGSCVARFYTLTSANDEPARDPKEWLLEASNDGGETWIVLDERHNEAFPFRFQTRVFELPQPAAYRSYRLRIIANYGDPYTQLAEVEFLSVRGQGAARAPTTRPVGSESAMNMFVCWVAKRCNCSVVAPGATSARSPLVLLALLWLLRVITGRAPSRHARNRADRRPAARGGKLRAPVP